jgi:hypothetical protein
MIPRLSNPSTCFYLRQDSYEIGDIVFSKVKGRWIDAHQITKIRADGHYMIANNRGYENGWTKQVYGKVYAAFDKHGKACPIGNKDNIKLPKESETKSG